MSDFSLFILCFKQKHLSEMKILSCQFLLNMRLPCASNFNSKLELDYRSNNRQDWLSVTVLQSTIFKYTVCTPMCNPLMCNIVPNVQHFFGEFRCCTLGYNRCNAFRRTKSTELNPRNLDFNRLSVEVIFTKISADLNEENNVIRLHLRRTERVLSEREARYFEVSAFLHT